MNLIDTMAISRVLNDRVEPSETYLLAPDVEDEAAMTKLRTGRGFPGAFKSITTSQFFDEQIYVRNYKVILNDYGTSFYNMTGFGDVSIAASLATAFECMDELSRDRLFTAHETVHIFTDDRKLRRYIMTKFDGQNWMVHDADHVS